MFCLQQVTSACGDTQWSAARTDGKTLSKKIDETGLYLVSCGHDIALAALNMKRGEIFAYPYYLQAVILF